MQVLIFDPSPESAEEISRILTAIGLESKRIRTLAEFISVLQQGPPRLIICEALISGYDDFVILEHVKNDRKLQPIPVIICCARPTREIIIKARRLGAAGFVPKPFEGPNLIKQVKLGPQYS